MPMPANGSATPARGRALLEAEAEACGIGLRAARPRHVDVELVRVLVVRDVEVGPAVAVDVDELRAEAVVGAADSSPAWTPTSRKRARSPSFRKSRSRTPAKFVGKPATSSATGSFGSV